MKRFLTICVLALAGLTPLSAQLVASHAPATGVKQQAGPTLQPVGKPVARVNGAVLTDRDLLREMLAMFPYARQHNGTIPPEMEPAIRKGAMDMIIFEELVYQEAVRRQMTVPPAKLQTSETDFRHQFSSASEFQQFLHTEFNGSQKALRDKIRRSLLIDSLLKAEVDNKSIVSITEARAYYDKNPARFQYPEAFAIQTISVLPPDKATPDKLREQRKRADEALKQAKATKTYEDFGLLAEKISDDDYRVMMGDHKAVERAKLAPQVVQALLAMKSGEVSDILQIDQALTIVRLNQHVLAGKTKFADVKDALQKELQKRKLNDVRAALDQRLRKTAKVEVL